MKKFDRIVRILELVSKPNAVRPTKHEIMKQIGAEGVSERTFRRDLEDLREEYGITVKPNLEHRYEIVSSDDEIRNNILMLINAQRAKSIVRQLQDDAFDLKEYVVVDTPGGIGGDWIDQILVHCQGREEIEITHKAYWREESKIYIVQPYQIREYDKRWYLVAWVNEKKKFQSFGLDRILEVTPTGKKFKRDREKDLSDMFDYMMGIWGYEYDPTEIKVWFDEHAKNYIKSDPWHWTQETIEENKDGITVRWRVTNNFELRKRLLSWSGQFKVLEPDNLKKEIHRLTESAANMNK